MSAQPFDRSRYVDILSTPYGGRIVTLASVRGTKHVAVIEEPCIGTDGAVRVETFTGRWAYRQARAEYDCATGRSP